MTNVSKKFGSLSPGDTFEKSLFPQRTLGRSRILLISMRNVTGCSTFFSKVKTKSTSTFNDKKKKKTLAWLLGHKEFPGNRDLRRNASAAVLVVGPCTEF